MARMDAEKLSAYRQMAEKSDFNDKAFNDFVEDRKARMGGKPVPVGPYLGISTLLGMPQAEGSEGLDVALCGLPYDMAVSNRPGTRFGPKAVREMSGLVSGPKNHETGVIPAAIARIADIGDVILQNSYDIEKAHTEIEAFYHGIADAGALPLTVGGDHSISYPILKALGREQPAGLIHIDAHADTGGPFNGTRFHHGGPFRNAVLDGVLDPERTIQIGIRGRAQHLWDFSYDSGMRVVCVDEFYELGVEKVLRLAREIAGSGPVYVSFDIDSIDPAFAPGTGTPEIGGLQPREVQHLLRGLAGLDLIGADVVEVSPSYDPGGNTAHVAAGMAWELLCLLAQSVRDRRQAG